jgi:hypothetical protein
LRLSPILAFVLLPILSCHEPAEDPQREAEPRRVEPLEQEEIEALPGRWQLFRPRTAERPVSPPSEGEIERLETLGYLSGVNPARAVSGVQIHRPDRAYQGLNFYVSGHAPEAILMDMNGEIIHKWGMDLFDALPQQRSRVSGRVPNNWRRAHLAPNGDVVVIYGGRGMAKLDRNSKLLWALDAHVHHDLEVLADGTVYTLARKGVLVTRVNPAQRVVADYVLVLSPDGELLDRFSVVDCLLDSPFPELIERIEARGSGDILHTNTIEFLDGTHVGVDSAFRRGNLLLSMREIDAIAVVDPEARRAVWSLSGPWRAQHQPLFLENGNLMLFDNTGLGERSRVMEIEPRTGKVVWSFGEAKEQRFFSRQLGSVQALPNGNVLISESDNGRAFEVTRSGEVVWEFVNPHRAGERDELVASVYELVRLAPGFPRDWADPATAALSIDVSETAR